MDRAGTTVVDYNKGQIAFFLILFLFLLGLSMVPIYDLLDGAPWRISGGSSDKFWFYGMDTAFILSTAWFVFGMARLLLRRGPALVLDARGLTVNYTNFTAATPRGFVPWSDISDITVIESRGRNSPTLYIQLKDGGRNGAAGGKIRIVTFALSMRLDELLLHLHRRLDASRAET